MFVFKERGKPEYPEKNLSREGKTGVPEEKPLCAE